MCPIAPIVAIRWPTMPCQYCAKKMPQIAPLRAYQIPATYEAPQTPVTYQVLQVH